MKTLLTLFALNLFSLALRAQTIPNAGFENWTNFGAYSDPTGWFSLNSMGIVNCDKGTPGYSGNGYLKLTVKSGAMSLVESTPTMGFGGSYGGFPCVSRPFALTGKWKYLVSPDDTAIVEVLFTKWNPSSLTSDVVGVGLVEIGAGSVGPWSDFIVPIDYMGLVVPDSALILLVVGATNFPVDNDYLYIDDLSFSGGLPSALSATPEVLPCSLVPNPCLSTSVLRFEELQRETSVVIMDMFGNRRRVYHITGSELSIAKDQLPSGCYLLIITDDKQNKRVVKWMIE